MRLSAALYGEKYSMSSPATSGIAEALEAMHAFPRASASARASTRSPRLSTRAFPVAKAEDFDRWHGNEKVVAELDHANPGMIRVRPLTVSSSIRPLVRVAPPSGAAEGADHQKLLSRRDDHRETEACLIGPMIASALSTSAPAGRRNGAENQMPPPKGVIDHLAVGPAKVVMSST